MSAGTITLTNGSDQISGSGTGFLTDSAAGDMVVAVVGGVTYTLPIKSVESNTTLTTTLKYDGPTQSGSAWTNVPRDTLNSITAQLGAEAARALRGLNFDKQNWQSVYSAPGDITVTLPDGSTFMGPSWNNIVGMIESVTAEFTPFGRTIIASEDAPVARSKLGLGNSATRNIGISSGTVAAGDDSRFSSINGKSGGVVAGDISIEAGNLNLRSVITAGWPAIINFMAGAGQNVVLARIYQEQYGNINIVTNMQYGAKYFQFIQTGQFVAPGNITCVSLTQTSDRNHKSNIEVINGALDKIEKISGYTYTLKDTGEVSAGVIAQELKDVLPEVVGEITRTIQTFDEDGNSTRETEEVTSCTVDYSGVSALTIEAIKELHMIVKRQQAQIKELQTKIKS
ncbi:tail fiber domain-containing protein [Limnobaculum xujianqingii]|uniref:tail fiber domain-containing protein n=1 Tax=Limnobaculum xujianqingii TaxID=2738837 RepID=UPI001128DAD0|nr:tail fiber domain-containing protein [Limnobaculum xujianqingii]